jgi:hypothetical protein
MAMGKRTRDRQPPLWVATTDLPTAASHPFYWRLNQLLREHGFDAFVKASGIGTPTRADLARLDRRRKKKGSNYEWTHPHDPDARITKMKDGRTHLAHKLSTRLISRRARSSA